MTTDNLTQSNSNSQFSRRSFLAALPGVTLLAGAGVIATRAALAVLSPAETVECMDCHQVMSLATAEQHVCPYTPPVDYPDQDRAAIITTWEQRLDQAITSLESLWGFLHQARAMAPEQVNGTEFLRFELAAFDQIGELSGQMETAEFEQLIQQVTGRRAYYWCIREQIESGPVDTCAGAQCQCKAVDLLSEINELAEDEPALAGELLVMLQGAQ